MNPPELSDWKYLLLFVPFVILLWIIRFFLSQSKKENTIGWSLYASKSFKWLVIFATSAMILIFLWCKVKNIKADTPFGKFEVEMQGKKDTIQNINYETQKIINDLRETQKNAIEYGDYALGDTIDRHIQKLKLITDEGEQLSNDLTALSSDNGQNILMRADNFIKNNNPQKYYQISIGFQQKFLEVRTNDSLRHMADSMAHMKNRDYDKKNPFK